MNRCLVGIALVVLGGWAPLWGAEGLSSETAAAMDTAAKTPEDVRFQERSTPGAESAVVAAQEQVYDPFALDASVPEPVATPEVPSASEGTAATVELQGIGLGSKDAYAIIGGEVFFTGDEKNGIKLLEVRRREVDILTNGETRTYPLFPGQDLQNAKERAKRKGPSLSASVDLGAETPPSSVRRE